jgi:hypothetical protein
MDEHGNWEEYRDYHDAYDDEFEATLEGLHIPLVLFMINIFFLI